MRFRSFEMCFQSSDSKEKHLRCPKSPAMRKINNCCLQDFPGSPEDVIIRLILCTGADLAPSKCSGAGLQAPPLAQIGRSWLPLQVWHPHLERESEASSSFRTEREKRRKGSGKCAAICGNEWIPNIVVVVNRTRVGALHWTGLNRTWGRVYW